MSPERKVITTTFLQANMRAPSMHRLGPGMAGVYSAHSPDNLTPNEDGAALVQIDEQACVLIVADGLGGQPAGEDAARVAIAAMQKALENDREEGAGLRLNILNGFDNANHQVQEIGVGAATTLVAVEICGNRVRTYHAGDSAVLLVGQRGKIKWQTIPHSPVGHAVESGWLNEKEAMLHEDRHLISNLVGSPEMRIEMGPLLKLAHYDTLLLASDGLYDNLHTNELIARIRKGPLEKAALSLARDARRRMEAPTPNKPSKLDDMTFIVYRRQGGGAQERQPH